MCYRLTWAGSLLVLTILIAGTFLFIRYIPYFLSVNQPVNGQILVLDGQMPDYIVEKAIEVYNQGSYELVVTTGTKLSEGYYLSGMKTMAELTRGTFLALGFDSTRVTALPTKYVARNRTFNSANTLNEWLSQRPEIRSVDVLTVGAHARRSLFLFEKALDDNIEVGIISLPHKGYDNRTWWKNSIGSRLVLSETIAFFYVWLTS